MRRWEMQAVVQRKKSLQLIRAKYVGLQRTFVKLDAYLLSSGLSPCISVIRV